MAATDAPSFDDQAEAIRAVLPALEAAGLGVYPSFTAGDFVVRHRSMGPPRDSHPHHRGSGVLSPPRTSYET